MIKFCCFFATLAPIAFAAEDGHDHGHDHGPACACVAEELGFDIDCGDRTSMMDAFTFLLDNDCDTDCSSPECAKNYFIIQSHHDYCLHDEVHEPLEDGIHNIEGTCEDCSIQRKPDPLLPACPDVSCEAGNAAYSALLSAGCNTFCHSNTCTENYRILRAVHDTCAKDVLSQSAEAGIHDFEEPCEPYNCNPGTLGGVQQLACNDNHDEGENVVVESDASGALNIRVESGLFAVVLAMMIIGIEI